MEAPLTPQPTQTHSPSTSSRLRSEEHTSELQSRQYLVCRLLLEKKKNNQETDARHRRNMGGTDQSDQLGTGVPHHDPENVGHSIQLTHEGGNQITDTTWQTLLS